MPRNALTAAALILAGIVIGYAISFMIRPSDDNQEVNNQEREILYWQAPMDPGYRSEKPGKSPMGMDLVPVYADQRTAAAQDSLRIDPAVVNNIGVRVAEVVRGSLARQIETIGFVTPDEEKLAHIHVRSEGWIENLVADTEGESVRRGDLLFEIYSRPVVSAQAEYLQVLGTRQKSLIAAAQERLAALGMSAAQIEELEATGEPTMLIGVRAPQDGIVMDLDVREGMYVTPGATIMSLADLSSIWIDVDIYEDQVGWVEEGQGAYMWLPSAPGERWAGHVEYIYPTIRPSSRTGRIRLTFDNPDLVLKPGMYTNVRIDAMPRENVLHIPREALIRSGNMERVILALGGGRFRPAKVQSGIESKNRVEIKRGLGEGERIVTSSQFLIDSEASLNAGLLRMLDPETAPEPQYSAPDKDQKND